MSDEEKKSAEEAPDFSKIIVGLVIAVVVLGGIVYGSYSLTQKKPGGQTFPAGFKQPVSDTPGANQGTTLASVNCAINQPNPDSVWAFYLKCDKFKGSENAKWGAYNNPEFGFDISLPSDLSTVEYQNGLGINYKNIQAADNLLFSADIASSRSGEFKDMKGDVYVKSWWKQFSGLVSLKSYEALTNQFNVKGHKAQYLNFANESPNEEVFFEIPNRPGDFIHFASGILDKSVYSKIIDSFKWAKK